jgi:hypothetical protein
MAGGGGAAAAGRSHALWLRCEGLMSGGFVVPWLEVTAAVDAARSELPAQLHVKPVPSVA